MANDWWANPTLAEPHVSTNPRDPEDKIITEPRCSRRGCGITRIPILTYPAGNYHAPCAELEQQDEEQRGT